MIRAFIEGQRLKGRAVESVCTVLRSQGVRIAARTYRSWKHAAPSTRDLTDAIIVDALLATVGTPEGLYGRRKMTSHLRRQGLSASKRRVDRLMRQEGLNGMIRGRGVRTTIPDKHADRAPDLLERDFTAGTPNRRWVADFTYVRTWAGFVYVAFVIDCYSRAIVGWHAATTKQTPLVTTALRMGLWRRDRAGHEIPAAWCIAPMREANTRPSISPKPSHWKASPHRSDPSGTLTTTPSLNRRSACSRTKQSATTARSGTIR